MRIAIKPLTLVKFENLKCIGRGMPADKIKITTDNFDEEGEYSLSSEFYQKYQK